MKDNVFTNYETRSLFHYLCSTDRNNVMSILDYIHLHGTANAVAYLATYYQEIETKLQKIARKDRLDYLEYEHVNYWEVVGRLLDHEKQQIRRLDNGDQN